MHCARLGISIHALREESDSGNGITTNSHNSFQSTLSVRRATHSASNITSVKPISIHALREESDTKAVFPVGYVLIFQSTLSVRRAT